MFNSVCELRRALGIESGEEENWYQSDEARPGSRSQKGEAMACGKAISGDGRLTSNDIIVTRIQCQRPKVSCLHGPQVSSNLPFIVLEAAGFQLQIDGSDRCRGPRI